MKTWNFLSLFCFILVGPLAMAATAKPTEDISVPIPQSQLSLPTREAPVSEASNFFIELQGSSWKASQLEESSNVAQTSPFSPTLPEASLQIGTRWTELSWAVLSSKWGVSFLQMQRTGSLAYQDGAIPVSQNLNMYQAGAGLDLMGTHDLIKNLRPVASVMLAPTWLQSTESEFNNGVSELDWLVKSSVGLGWNFPGLAKGLGLHEIRLEGGVENTLPLNGVKMADTALWLGARFGWK